MKTNIIRDRDQAKNPNNLGHLLALTLPPYFSTTIPFSSLNILLHGVMLCIHVLNWYLNQIPISVPIPPHMPILGPLDTHDIAYEQQVLVIVMDILGC